VRKISDQPCFKENLFSKKKYKHISAYGMNGKEEKSGTFLYTLEYTLLDGTSGTKSGNVTLIR
jgi:hypothetical protein